MHYFEASVDTVGKTENAFEDWTSRAAMGRPAESSTHCVTIASGASDWLAIPRVIQALLDDAKAHRSVPVQADSLVDKVSDGRVDIDKVADELVVAVADVNTVADAKIVADSWAAGPVDSVGLQEYFD